VKKVSEAGRRRLLVRDREVHPSNIGEKNEGGGKGSAAKGPYPGVSAATRPLSTFALYERRSILVYWGAWAAASSRRLLAVVLDCVHISHGGIVRIEPRTDAGPSLPQEVPALIKTVFEPLQPFSVLLGKVAAAFALAQLVFLVRQDLNVEQDVVACQI
jgi:hypothetical protein